MPKASEESKKLALERFNESISFIVKIYEKKTQLSLRDGILNPTQGISKGIIT